MGGLCGLVVGGNVVILDYTPSFHCHFEHSELASTHVQTLIAHSGYGLANIKFIQPVLLF